LNAVFVVGGETEMKCVTIFLIGNVFAQVYENIILLLNCWSIFGVRKCTAMVALKSI